MQTREHWWGEKRGRGSHKTTEEWREELHHEKELTPGEVDKIIIQKAKWNSKGCNLLHYNGRKVK